MSYEVDIESSAYIRKTNESVSSNAFINFVNLLDIAYDLTGFEDKSDILSNVNISWCKDLLTRLYVKALGNHDTTSTANIYKYTDLLTSVFIPYRNDLLGKVNITDQMLLNIVYKLIQAPVHIINLTDIQDAYIRESRDTLNYGTLQTLVCGKLLDGQYQTLLEFNSQAFNNLKDVDILSAELILTTSSNYDDSYTYYIYEVEESWNETSVTWSNFTQKDRKLIKTFKCSSNIVSIDLLSYLNELKAKYSNKVNLLIVGEQDTEFVTYFQARESPDENSRPHIKIRYQEKSWNGYIDNTTITNYATIRSLNARDLQSKLQIRNQKDLDSFVQIQRDNINDILGSGIVYYPTDIPGIVEIKNFHLFLNSLVKVRHSNITDITNTANIYIPTELDSTVGIRNSRVYDKPSKAKSRHSNFTEIDSSSYTKQQAEFSSTAKIRRSALYDILGFISVAYGNNLNSTAVIKSLANNESSNLISNVRVRRKEIFDMDSFINVVESKDLESTAILKAFRSYDILSTMFSRLSTFNGLDSTAIIRQFDVAEVTSLAYLFGGQISDLNSVANIQNFGTNYLDCKVAINTTARQWIPNIHGKDIFTYEDRKLPRVWKRENFIFD